MKVKQQSKRQKLLDLAVILPIMVLLVIGMIDLGRVYASLSALQTAANRAADYVSQHPEHAAEDSTSVLREMPGGESNFDSTPIESSENIHFHCAGSDLTTGHSITVSLTYTMPMYTPIIKEMTEMHNGIPLSVAIARPIQTTP